MVQKRPPDGGRRRGDFGISFISKELLEELSSPKTSIKVDAVDRLKDIIEDDIDIGELRGSLTALVSILQPVIADRNVQVIVLALQTIQVILKKIQYKLTTTLEMFISVVLIQIGSTSANVRHECMKICHHAMELCGAHKVIEQICRKFQVSRVNAREEMVNVITAALLRHSGSNKIDMERLTVRLSKLLLDKNPNVRMATLECFAVISYILGPAGSLLDYFK